MDAIQTDSHVDNRIKRCIDCTKVRVCRICMGREREVRTTNGTLQMTAAKKIAGCSSMTSNTVLRAELGVNVPI